MSAWLVSNYHVNALATFAVDQRLTNHAPAALALDLWRENRASVRYRYADADQVWPQLITLDADFRYDDVTTPSLWHVLKAARCLACQSSEHPGWVDSAARTVCDAIQARCFAMLGTTPAWVDGRFGHPHYDAAPWGLDAPKDEERA
jgi:hypothetical protein